MTALRWGVLGAGGIVTGAMGGAITAATGADWTRLGSRSEERGAAVAARFAVPSVTADYAEVVEADDVDAVYVALANDAHLPWTLAALRAGKHVLCEKPLGMTAEEVEQMQAAAAAADRLVVEASWYRWHPRVRLAQQVLAEGSLGKVRHVAAAFGFTGVPADNYRLDPALGGGALYDVGCYAISAVLWAFGTPPREVSARCRLGPTGVDLTTELIIDFDGGTAEVLASIDSPSVQRLVITTERGEVELPEPTYTAWLTHHTELLISDGRTTERRPAGEGDAYRMMVEEFSSVATGGPGWVLPLEESLTCARVIDAAFESSAAGAPVAL
jgi:predicted dehydrogenase